MSHRQRGTANNARYPQNSAMTWRPAGKTTISFAPEPEAAALATISEQGYGVKAGDVYVICDAGGGTVVSLYFLTRLCPPFPLDNFLPPLLLSIFDVPLTPPVGSHQLQDCHGKSYYLNGGGSRGNRYFPHKYRLSDHQVASNDSNCNVGGLCGGIFVMRPLR